MLSRIFNKQIVGNQATKEYLSTLYLQRHNDAQKLNASKHEYLAKSSKIIDEYKDFLVKHKNTICFLTKKETKWFNRIGYQSMTHVLFSPLWYVIDVPIRYASYPLETIGMVILLPTLVGALFHCMENRCIHKTDCIELNMIELNHLFKDCQQKDETDAYKAEINTFEKTIIDNINKMSTTSVQENDTLKDISKNIFFMNNKLYAIDSKLNNFLYEIKQI